MRKLYEEIRYLKQIHQMVSQFSLEQRIFHETEFIIYFYVLLMYATHLAVFVYQSNVFHIGYELCCTIMKIMEKILHGCLPAHLKKGRPTLHSVAYRSNFLVLIAVFIFTVFIAVIVRQCN